MPVRFATFFAHQTVPNYSSYQGLFALGRPYRQALSRATDGLDVVEALEILLGDDAAVSGIYAWLDGEITWRPADASSPTHRLAFTTMPTIMGSTAPTLRRVQTIEACPARALYDNVDQAGVQSALVALLQAAYNFTVANPTPVGDWHPSMLQNVTSGGQQLRMDQFIAPNPQQRIADVVNSFLGQPTATVAVPGGPLLVRAGDLIGRAATYTATPAPPPERARKVLFSTRDICDQPINPLYYLHHYMRQMLLTENARAVRSLTDIVEMGRLRHPLVELFPALNTAEAAAGGVARATNLVTVTSPGHGLRAPQKVKLTASTEADFPAGLKTVTEAAADYFRYQENGADASSTTALSYEAVPLAREQYLGASRFPIASLNGSGPDGYHRWLDPSPTVNQPHAWYEWRLTDLGIFEARNVSTQQAVAGLGATQRRRNQLRNLWNARGSELARVSDLLQVPMEVIFAVIGAEALQNGDNLNERSLAIEPLKPDERVRLRAMHPAHELPYDQAIGVPGTAQQVTLLPDGLSNLAIVLNAARVIKPQEFSRLTRYMLISDADRLRINAHTAAPLNGNQYVPITNYTFTLRDAELQRRPGNVVRAGWDDLTSGAAAMTYFFDPNAYAQSAGAPAGVALNMVRAGTLRRLRVTADWNSLTVPVTIELIQTPNTVLLTTTLAAGQTAADNLVGTAPISAGNAIAVRVTIPASSSAKILRGLNWKIGNAPPGNGVAWPLPPLLGVTVPPWNGAGLVRASQSTLTWEQLAEVADATLGTTLTPGLMQTKPGTARAALLWARERLGEVFQPIPNNFGDYLRDYLLDPVNAIWAGAAYIRQGYLNGSRFDLPPVGSAYNAGTLPQTDTTSPWGLRYFANYVETAAPMGNAAAELFEQAEASPPAPPPAPPPLTPLPGARFMR